MFLVLDTNVIVSALLSPGGKPAFIVKQVLDGDYALCCDKRILQEYEIVLKRKKFNFKPERIDELMRYIRSHCICVDPAPINMPFIDEADKKFYEVAKHCKVPLVTGNKKHFPHDELVRSVHEI